MGRLALGFLAAARGPSRSPDGCPLKQVRRNGPCPENVGELAPDGGWVGITPRIHQQKNLFHRRYRARVRTKPVRSLPPVLPDLLSPLCLSSLASGAPGRPTFPPKRPTPSLRSHPLPAPSCCIRPLIFSSTGLLPTLTNCAHPAALPDPLSPLAT